MHQTPPPPPESLPTKGALLRSTVIAALVAVALLFTMVLPAEYGVDPTGVGDLIGLKRMGEIKVALALEAEADAAADAAARVAEEEAAANFSATTDTPVATDASDSTTARTETYEITLQPDEGKEVKLRMVEGARVNYEWWTLSGVVNSELHADDPPDAPGTFHSYRKGTAEDGDEGLLTAEFDGMHGWFWRNRTDAPVTITLRVEGDFEELREM